MVNIWLFDKHPKENILYRNNEAPVTQSLFGLPLKAMKRKGGIQQRMKEAKREREAQPRDPELTSQSALVTFLLTMFAWGEFSPQRCQHIASLVAADMKKMEEDGSILQDITLLASLGCNGAYANKMHGDLMTAAKGVSRLPQPYMFQTTFKDPLKKQNQTLLLPHEMFSCIYHMYQETWTRSVVPAVEQLELFWENAVKHPLMQGHPVLTRPSWRKFCVPLGLHGDGVPVVGIGKVWSKMLDVFSWYSLIGTGNTRSKLFYTHSVFQKMVQGQLPNGTFGSFFRVLQWSFYWLFQGVWPDEDHMGRKFLWLIYI